MNDPYNPRPTIAGAGPGLVLVPGVNGNGGLFYRQIPRLAKSYRVASYSLRDNAPSLEVLSDDLSGIVHMVAPDDRRAVIVGESFGGTVALTFALRHPEQVSRLVILNSFPFFAPQVRLRLGIAALGVMPWRLMPALRRLSAFRLHSQQTDRADVEEFVRRTADATRDGYINRLRLLRAFDVRSRLGEITCPALFLAAERDHLVPAVSEARYMSERVHGSHMQILEGHGHICLVAPNVDLEQILAQWPAGRDVRPTG